MRNAHGVLSVVLIYGVISAWKRGRDEDVMCAVLCTL